MRGEGGSGVTQICVPVVASGKRKTEKNLIFYDIFTCIQCSTEKFSFLCAAFLRQYSYICSHYVLRFTSLILRYVVSWKFQSAFDSDGEEEADGVI